MKGFFGLILLLYSFTVLAADTCYLFELKGSVKAHKDHVALIVAPGSQSETSLKAPIRVQEKLFPYFNYSVSAEVVLTTKNVSYHSEIIDIISVERSIPDPLNAGTETVKKFKKEVPCR